MKQEEKTLQTKKALTASLKQKLEKKPISQITVSELCLACDLNRKTFYYHFEDIFDLFKWMLEEDTFAIIKQFDLLVDYKDAILFVMNYIEENKHILNCVLDSIGREGIKRFLVNDFYTVTDHVIDQAARQEQLRIPEDFKKFLSVMYSEAIAGILIESIQGKEKYNKERTLDYLSLMIKTSLYSVLHAAAEKYSKTE